VKYDNDCIQLEQKTLHKFMQLNKELEMERLEKRLQNQSLVQPLPTSEQTT
jgi:hypothetical protein